MAKKNNVKAVETPIEENEVMPSNEVVEEVVTEEKPICEAKESVEVVDDVDYTKAQIEPSEDAPVEEVVTDEVETPVVEEKEEVKEEKTTEEPSEEPNNNPTPVAKKKMPEIQRQRIIRNYNAIWNGCNFG